MKNLEQIRELLNSYSSLIALAKKKIEILENHDAKYNTAKGIEDISFDEFENDTVYVKCDDSCRGCYDSLSFSFPLSYLILTDDDLIKVVEKEKSDRIEKEKLKKEQYIIKDKNDREQKELEQYQRLKAKFENGNN